MTAWVLRIEFDAETRQLADKTGDAVLAAISGMDEDVPILNSDLGKMVPMVMAPHDFPYTFRWDMVQAYPRVSEVQDIRVASPEQVDAGFQRIIDNKLLQPTLQAYLVQHR